ncbi:hypothetical protein LguiB_007464 [Lonicera macranthoides]
MSGAMRNKVHRKFKMRGYTLKVEALTEILSFVSRFEDAEDEALDLLLDELQHQSLKSSILDKEPVNRVVNLLLEAEAAVEETPTTPNSASTSGSNKSALRIIDAFFIPKFRYDPVRKIFYEPTGRLPIHGDASAKATLYRDRFLLLLQRLSRDPSFTKPAFDTEVSQFGSCEISPIQSLVGRIGRSWVIGVISQLEDGHFYLEDLTAAYKITTGFFSENTIVLAEGEMLLDGIFQRFSTFFLLGICDLLIMKDMQMSEQKVKTCGFPPLEDRYKSLALFSGLDFFGGGILTKEENLRLAELETSAVNDMFVILSDIFLDNEETLGKLETVLDGYESVEVVPSLFVFMGNFCSHPCNLSFNAFSSLRLQFGKLGQMIANHQRLKDHSRFLFIPGPDDAGPSTVLPRCALPRYITEELQKYIPNAIFSSNPCRIKFYTQEIVFFREDLLYRMRRSCLMPPSTEETSDPFEHIVLGDRSEQKAFNYTGITCFNPGSFSNDSTFVAYRPCTREVELSAL